MSKIDPIYVYNKHRSPVSALCFGKYENETVLITGSNDGELHVWNLINFETLIKIQVHQSKILGLESLLNDQNINQNDKMNEKLMNKHSTTIVQNEDTDQTTNQITNQIEQSKSRLVNENCKLRFVSQEKNGLIKFICLLRDEVNVKIYKFKIYNELTCSDCTFCPFQVFRIKNLLFLVCISIGLSDCVNLVIMNEDELIFNKKIIKIDQNLGIISSMRMQLYDNLILLLIGTENGSCLIYTTYLKDELIIEQSSSSTESNKQKSRESNEEYKRDCIKNVLIDEFSLKYSQKCFHDTFISSIELNDIKLTLNGDLQLICGSVEDCLAIVNLIVDLSQTGVNADNYLTNEQTLINANRKTISIKNKDDSTGKPVKYLKVTNKGINSIVKRMDNKLFASCGYDGRIRLFSLKTLNALAVLIFHKQTIEMIKFSTYLPKYNGYLLAAAGQDKLVTIWSIYNS